MTLLLEIPFLVFSVAGIWLGVDYRPLRRLVGCLCGVAAQPYWFWVAHRAGSMVATLIAIAYTVAWIHGAWKNYREISA